jgi:hypothetical protein
MNAGDTETRGVGDAESRESWNDIEKSGCKVERLRDRLREV